MSESMYSPAAPEGIAQETATQIPEFSNHGQVPVAPKKTRSLAMNKADLFRWIALAVACVWLVASVVIGMEIMKGSSSASPSLSATMPQLTPSAKRMSYGGDAYTGIQNAAAETENSVIKSANGLAELAVDLENASADYNRGLVQDAVSPLAKGLGFLIIGVGVVNFTIALSRVSLPGRSKADGEMKPAAA